VTPERPTPIDITDNRNRVRRIVATVVASVAIAAAVATPAALRVGDQDGGTADDSTATTVADGGHS